MRSFFKADICYVTWLHVFLSLFINLPPNWDLEGDMGWLSCYNRHCLSVLRSSNRLLKLLANWLTKKIFIDDFYLAQSGHDNWCYNVLKLLSNVNLESSFHERKQIDIEMIKENVMNIQEENWLHSVSNKQKLRSCKLLNETLLA